MLSLLSFTSGLTKWLIFLPISMRIGAHVLGKLYSSSNCTHILVICSSYFNLSTIKVAESFYCVQSSPCSTSVSAHYLTVMRCRMCSEFFENSIIKIREDNCMVDMHLSTWCPMLILPSVLNTRTAIKNPITGKSHNIGFVDSVLWFLSNGIKI